MVKIPSISIIGAIKKSQDRMQPDMLKEGKKQRKNSYDVNKDVSELEIEK